MITPEERQKLLDFVNSLEVEQAHKPTKISELKENDVIHTETEAEYYRISILLHLAGKKWCDGDSYLSSIMWGVYKEKSCLLISKGEHCPISYYVSKGYTIIPSTQITGV